MAGVSSDTRSVIRSTQRSPTPLCARERSGQRGKQRHIPDWIDRRPNGRKILADFNQKWGHALNILSEGQICFHFIIHPSYFYFPFGLIRATDQARGKVGDVKWI